MSLSRRRIHVLTVSSVLIAGFGSLFVQAIAEDGVSDKSGLVLPVPAAVASTAAEMKPYSDPLEHTDITLDMVPIPGGKFIMGSSESEPHRNQDEGALREVEISPFWMGKFEVTWDQYDAWREDIDQLRRKLMSIKAGPRDLAAHNFI